MKKKVFSATVTPLLPDGRLDGDGLKNVFARNIRHGLDGFFLLGSMGEWGSFDTAFKHALVGLSSELVGRQAELLVGINATSLPLSLQLMRDYSGYAFDSYVYMLPGRTSAPDPVRTVVTVLDRADRPVYYYHCPPNNGVDLNLSQFATLLQHPNLKGVKNSASNMWLRRELILLKAELGSPALLLEGQEWATDEALMCGYDGMLCGMGALAARVMVSLARAADSGDYLLAVRQQNLLIELFHGIYGRDLANVWNGQKYALQRLGVIASAFTFAQEMSTLTEAACSRIDACLERYRAELD